MSDDPTARILAALERLAAGQDRLRADFDKRGGEIDRLRGDLMARMDRLQDAITLQHDDVIVSMGAAERAERIARGASEETRALGEIVTVQTRQIQRLQSDIRQLKGGAVGAAA